MKIIGFNYLQKQHLIALTFILTITSTLFSLTALSFFSFYKTINAYLGETENILAIYDKKSTTPFTGFFSLQLVTHLKTIGGVITASPETFTPGIIEGESILIRGIIPEEFSKLNPLVPLEGENLEMEDFGYAMIGKGLADTIGITLSDKILVQGVLAERYIELNIKGIFESNSVLDDELLVPLYVGQWLRGKNYDYVTMIRVKIDESEITTTQLFQQIAEMDVEAQPDTETESNTLIQILPSSGAILELEKLGVKNPSQIMNTYLDRYGMSPHTLLILSIIVLVLANATIFAASWTLILQHKPEIMMLRALGLSLRALKLDLAIKVLPWSVAASILGTLISIFVLQGLEKMYHVQAFSHTVHFQPDATLIAINFMLVSIMAILALVRSTSKMVLQ